MRGGHPHQLRQACEQSLKNLNITTHSLYYLHGPDPDVPLADSLGEIINLKNEGKINAIGIANVTLTELQIAHELTSITAVQNRCNPFCKEDFKNGVFNFCKANKILYVPYCPLGGWADHQKLANHACYQELMQQYQVSSYVISLAWLTAKGHGIVPIPGMDQVSQVRENFSALQLHLSSEAMQKIDQFPDFYSPKHVD